MQIASSSVTLDLGVTFWIDFSRLKVLQQTKPADNSLSCYFCVYFKLYANDDRREINRFHYCSNEVSKSKKHKVMGK